MHKGDSVDPQAKAIWRGTGRAGSGTLSSDSGVLAETPCSFKARFESEKGTNPEELIAAAHAGCFNMALAFQLQGAGFDPMELSTEAAVSIDPEGQGFASPARRSLCAPRCQIWTERPLLSWLRRRRQTVRFQRPSTPRSPLTPS